MYYFLHQKCDNPWMLKAEDMRFLVYSFGTTGFNIYQASNYPPDLPFPIASNRLGGLMRWEKLNPTSGDAEA